MGMSKEEFMARYMKDKAKKEAKISNDLKGYYGERSKKLLKQQIKNRKYKRLCM